MRRSSGLIPSQLTVLSSRSLFGSLLLFLLLLGIAAFGQTSNTGAIGGIVTDSTGAVVPGARVQATNRATNEVPSNYSGPVPAGVIKSSNASAVDGDGQNTLNPRVGFAWQLKA
jgi:hypothetical protein